MSSSSVVPLLRTKGSGCCLPAAVRPGGRPRRGEAEAPPEGDVAIECRCQTPALSCTAVDAARIEKEAKAAVYEFVARSLLFFVPGRRNDMPPWVATGTAFLTPAGRAVVLTAAHNVEEAIKGKPLRLGHYRSDDVVDDVVARIDVHPDAVVDAAAVALKPEATDSIAEYTNDVSMIAADDDVQHDQHALVIAGFPSVLMQAAEQQRPGMLPLRKIGFMSLTHGTRLQDPPRDEHGRFRVEWAEYELPDKTTIAMPEPHGISGGALWRFARAKPGELWTPPSAGSLIGVPVSFLRSTRTAFAEPASKWRAWFLDVLNVIDRDLPWEPRAPMRQ